MNSTVDQHALLARVDGDRLFLKELVKLFLDDCPQLLTAVRDAIARQDAPALHRAGHTLKGSVGNFCAAAAFEACLRLEMACRAKDFASAAATYVVLERALKKLGAALNSLVQSHETDHGIRALVNDQERNQIAPEAAI